MAFTSHGHHILHSRMEPPFFGKIVNCGGTALCLQCRIESAQYNHPTSQERKKDQ